MNWREFFRYWFGQQHYIYNDEFFKTVEESEIRNSKKIDKIDIN